MATASGAAIAHTEHRLSAIREVRTGCLKRYVAPSPMSRKNPMTPADGVPRTACALTTTVMTRAESRKVARSKTSPLTAPTHATTNPPRVRPIAWLICSLMVPRPSAVSYTHLRAHETRHDLVCRLLLEK